MRTLQRSLVALLVVALCALGFASDAAAQPRAQGKVKVATQADIDRLEKKIEQQQKLLDKLLRLQQQYLQALMAMMPDTPTSSAGGDVQPLADKVEPKVEPKASLNSKIEARPAVVKLPAKRVEGTTGTVVGKVKGGVGDIFVYVDDISVPGRGTASMKQEGKQFVPRVLAVQKGTRVDFPNQDAIFHNVFSVTPDHSFDLGSYSQGASKSVTMSKPGVVSVYCNMHPQMSGHVLVVPSSLYVRAGADGFFRLANVPAGKRRVVAWAPNAKAVVTEVDVAEGEATTVELELKRGRSLPHKNKEGLPYGSYKE